MLKSVKSRLTFLFLSVMAVLLALFCVSLYLWIYRTLDRELERELALQLRLFQENFLNTYAEVEAGRRTALGPELERSLAPTGAVATVTRADGTVVFSSNSGPRTGYRGRAAKVRNSDGEFTVTLAVREADMRRRLREVLLYFTIFVPVMLLLSWISGLLFVGRTLTPLEQIRRQAEQISRTSLTERVPEPRTGTEFQRLAQTFNEMLARIERAFEDLQNFAADAAHELRTPLANLRVELETALQEPSRVPDPLLVSLAEEIHRMSRIVTDLLTLAKLDLRQYALRKERVELEPILREVCETWGPIATERRIEVTVRECASGVFVDGDAVALRRVLMNLVENAVKYNRDGGRVDLILRRADGTIVVEVGDTGPGIPADHLPRLFRRFYRVDKARSRETGGAGLGLALCKSFIEAHEGTIAVRSVEGQGTMFTVTLPAAREML